MQWVNHFGYYVGVIQIDLFTFFGSIKRHNFPALSQKEEFFLLEGRFDPIQRLFVIIFSAFTKVTFAAQCCLKPPQKKLHLAAVQALFASQKTLELFMICFCCIFVLIRQQTDLQVKHSFRGIPLMLKHDFIVQAYYIIL